MGHFCAYLWALRTIVGFLAHKCHEIGKRITINTIRIFCIDMSGLCWSWTRMMAACYVARVLLLLWLLLLLMMRLSKNTKQMSGSDSIFWMRNIVYKPLQLYGFTWNLCGLLLHLCFAFILGCMIFRRFGYWTVLVEHSCTWTKRLRICLYEDCCVV